MQSMSGLSTRDTERVVQVADAAVLSAPNNHPTNRSRYIPVTVKREVSIRAQGSCEYIHPNEVRCGSIHALEIHHVQAYSKDGTNLAQNLKLYCRTHNALEGVIEFGRC